MVVSVRPWLQCHCWIHSSCHYHNFNLYAVNTYKEIKNINHKWYKLQDSTWNDKNMQNWWHTVPADDLAWQLARSRAISKITPLPMDKMAAILQMTYSDSFSWMKSFVFWFAFWFRLMDWHWICDKPLPEPMLIQFTDTDIWYYGSSEAAWLIYALVNWVNFGSGNGLLPSCHQANTWANADLLSIRPLGTIFCNILIKMQQFSAIWRSL